MRILDVSMISLLAVIAAAPSVHGQDRPLRALGAGIGIGVVEQSPGAFPGISQGIPLLEAEKAAVAMGPSAAIVGAHEVARFGDIPVFIELSASFTAASSSGSSIHDMGASDAMLLTYGSPQGTIDLDAAGTSGSAVVTNPEAGTSNVAGSSIPGGGNQAVLGFNRGGASGAYAAIATDGSPESAAAYGAILSPDGFVFAGVGDMDGTLVQSTVSRSSIRGGLEAMFGAPVALADGLSIIPKIGASYRYAGDEIGHEILIDASEGGLPDRFPTVGLRTSERLQSHMIGPVASLSLNQDINRQWSVFAGVDAGWLFSTSSWEMSAVGFMEGMPETQLPGYSASAVGGTGLFRLKGGASYVADNGTVFSLNGQMEHLTASPAAAASAPAVAAGGGSLDLSLPTAATPVSMITVPTMEYALSVSISRQF